MSVFVSVRIAADKPGLSSFDFRSGGRFVELNPFSWMDLPAAFRAAGGLEGQVGRPRHPAQACGLGGFRFSNLPPGTASIGISHWVSCPRPAWAFFLIFFLVHRFASRFSSPPSFFLWHRRLFRCLLRL